MSGLVETEEAEVLQEAGIYGYLHPLDASVPFKFDTNALIFSDDAAGLETKLHSARAGRPSGSTRRVRACN